MTLSTNRGYATWQNKPKIKTCNPTICGTDLLSGNNEYMDKTRIKEQCNCVNKQLCIVLTELLDTGNFEEANHIFNCISNTSNEENNDNKREEGVL